MTQPADVPAIRATGLRSRQLSLTPLRPLSFVAAKAAVAMVVAAGIASGLIVIMAFLGNVFSPMSGLLLEIGRLTPLYGYAALARYPITEGWTVGGDHDPLWLPVANVSSWTVIFALVAVLGVRRSRART